jgi:hypothetical protein
VALDWADYRVLTRRGKFRARVFVLKLGVVFREPLGPYAHRDTHFDSIADLKKVANRKGWRLVRESILGS